jgi:hypothetical protein
MRKPAIAIMAVMAVPLVGTAVFLNDPDPVGRHLSALNRLEHSRPARTFVDYFKPDTWEWCLEGRPSFLQIGKQMDAEYQRLVLLGFFETRDFKLTNRSVDSTGIQEFYDQTTNLTFSDYHARWTTAPGNPSIIRVTASRKDMSKWETAVSRFDQR